MNAALTTLQSLGIAAVRTDGDGRICEATDAFSAIASAACDGKTIGEALNASEIPTAGVYKIARGTDVAWYRAEPRRSGNDMLVVFSDVSAGYRDVEDVRRFYMVRDALLKDGKVGTWRYDPDTETYQFSLELSLGYEQAVGGVPLATLLLIQHPEDHARDAEIRDRITREGGTACAEMRYLESDGSWTTLLVHYRSGERLPSGRYEMFGISQNVTPVAAARDAAAQQSVRLRFALKAAQAGVFEYDYVKKSYWISQATVDLLGPDTLQRAANRPLELLAPEDQERMIKLIGDVERDGRGGSLELRMKRDTGRIWVRIYYDISSRDADGKPLMGVGLLLDIDQQKRQEFALASARRAAEVANRSKSEFLANMSHELRTPLNAILGFSEMIGQEILGPIGAKYLEYARDIHASGRHLLELVNDVLDLSKLEAGKVELHETDIDVSALIADCLTLVKARADSGQVALKVEIAPGFPGLRADLRSLKQVMLNLLTNAVKFTPEGGDVVISAEIDRKGAVDISVRDTGIGMSQNEVEIALTPFGQVDSHLSRKHEGTGLGLPICKSLIELHGGTLAVASEPNVGTRVTVRFPATRTIRSAERIAS
jgi:signal transduction histidine kinase